MVKEKPGFLTAKAFSNRIKSKGLQKLRWYCQTCQKQCRDENGFKCHMMAESHHRQMLIFDEHPDSVISEYTRAFMKGFLDILKRGFGGKRTQANVVYQEYIKEKEHVHMNSTKFTTLTGFIHCLQKMGLVAVDQTEKGWFIEYVAKDPEAEHNEKKKRRLQQSEMEEDEHFFEMINKKRKETVNEDLKNEYTEFVKVEDEKISMSFMKESIVEGNVLDKKKEVTSSVDKSRTYVSSWDEIKEDIEKNNTKPYEVTKVKRESTMEPVKKTEKKLTVLDEIRMEQEKLKEKVNRKNYWLHEGIVVKLIDTHLPKEFLKKEVQVRELEDRYTAIVKTIDVEGGNKKMKVKQEHVMTVVPPVGGKIMIVNGAYRGYKGRVLSLDKKRFSADVQLVSGIHSGMKLCALSYDDISKLFEQN